MQPANPLDILAHVAIAGPPQAKAASGTDGGSSLLNSPAQEMASASLSSTPSEATGTVPPPASSPPHWPSSASTSSLSSHGSLSPPFQPTGAAAAAAAAAPKRQRQRASQAAGTSLAAATATAGQPPQYEHHHAAAGGVPHSYHHQHHHHHHQQQQQQLPAQVMYWQQLQQLSVDKTTEAFAGASLASGGGGGGGGPQRHELEHMRASGSGGGGPNAWPAHADSGAVPQPWSQWEEQKEGQRERLRHADRSGPPTPAMRQELHQPEHQHQHQQHQQAAVVLLRPMREGYTDAIITARDGIARGISHLAARGRLDRRRVEALAGVLESLARVRRQLSDVSVGVLPLLRHLLNTQPQAFLPEEEQQRALAAVGARGGGSRRRVPDQGGVDVTTLVQCMTADESACFALSHMAPGGDEVLVCNQRMAEMFMSTEEYRGLIAQTGVGSPHFWPQFLCGPGLEEVFSAFAAVMLDPFARPQLDVIVQCRTRQGQVVRCVASIGTLISEEGPGSINILRVLPCVGRDFGPAPSQPQWPPLPRSM